MIENPFSVYCHFLNPPPIPSAANKKGGISIGILLFPPLLTKRKNAGHGGNNNSDY